MELRRSPATLDYETPRQRKVADVRVRRFGRLLQLGGICFIAMAAAIIFDSLHSLLLPFGLIVAVPIGIVAAGVMCLGWQIARCRRALIAGRVFAWMLLAGGGLAAAGWIASGNAGQALARWSQMGRWESIALALLILGWGILMAAGILGVRMRDDGAGG